MLSALINTKPIGRVIWSHRRGLMKALSVMWCWIMLKEINLVRTAINFEMNFGSRILSNRGEPLHDPFRSLDILSVGSITRPKYLQSQLETWASHVSIRSFIGVTEMDDHNQTCSQMSSKETLTYISSCRTTPSFSAPIKAFAREHYSHTEGDVPDTYVFRTDPGWHCAQRRFGQSLQVLENSIRNSAEETIADYVVMVDDDTFFNANMFQDHIALADPDEARVYAGCLFEANETINIPYDFPYGGFGVVFSKGAVKRMIKPVYCSMQGLRGNRDTDSSANTKENDDYFLKNACNAIQSNRIGEEDFFQEGMSIVDLISEYSARSPQLCLHSDWLIGYMAKYYLSLKPPVVETNSTTIYPILTWPHQCGNHSLVNTCNSKAMFCHRQAPEDMAALTEEMREVNPESFRYGSLVHDTSMAFTNIANITSHVASLSKLKAVKPTANHILHVSDSAKAWLKDFKSSKKIKANEIAQRESEEANAWLEMLRNDTILQEQQASTHRDPEYVWKAPLKWITPRQILPPTIYDNELAHIFDQLRNGEILKATSATGGSQLKLLLELKGGQQVIFKPMRVHPGNDLHSSEIAAFHVSRLLDIRRAPITVGRRLDIEKEILPVATPEFRDTFTNAEGKKNCFYGICEHCRHPVCPREDGTMEGVMILFLPKEIREGSDLVIGHTNTRFPLKAWNDKDRERAELMKTKDYCDAYVKPESPLEPRILDVVETAIFDFLTQNIDRHTHEFVDEEDNGAVLLIDQGKSFLPESAEYDEMKLLVPLVSCCILRETFFEQLQWISRWNMSFSDALVHLTSVDIASHARGKKNILSDGELSALDRRLGIVLDAINTCLDERGREEVLMDSPQ